MHEKFGLSPGYQQNNVLSSDFFNKKDFFSSHNSSDAISENQPRVIDDSRARKLANDLKRCAYYETCATYGLNVERVFQDGK